MTEDTIALRLRQSRLYGTFSLRIGSYESSSFQSPGKLKWRHYPSSGRLNLSFPFVRSMSAPIVKERRGKARKPGAVKIGSRSSLFCPGVASPRGFEPPTSGLGNRCSIRLSYGDVGPDIASDPYGVCLFFTAGACRLQ